MDGQGRFDLGGLGAGSVDGERSATDLFEREGQERRPVRDAELGERLVVAAVLVEQLIRDGVEGVVHAQGPFAGELAAQQHDVVRR